MKLSLLTDGAGIPLAIVIDGANRHDMKLLCATLDGIVIARPAPTQEQPQHLCLDAGYDYPANREQVGSHHYLPHIRGRGQEKQEKVTTPGFRDRRWVSGMHSFLDQSFPSPPGPVGKEGGELSGFSSSCLRSTHFCENSGFWISS